MRLTGLLASLFLVGCATSTPPPNQTNAAAAKPVKNEDLWRRLDAATQRHKVAWRWVKGHAGTELNERADELAREGMAPFKRR